MLPCSCGHHTYRRFLQGRRTRASGPATRTTARTGMVVLSRRSSATGVSASIAVKLSSSPAKVLHPTSERRRAALRPLDLLGRAAAARVAAHERRRPDNDALGADEGPPPAAHSLLDSLRRRRPRCGHAGQRRPCHCPSATSTLTVGSNCRATPAALCTLTSSSFPGAVRVSGVSWTASVAA